MSDWKQLLRDLACAVVWFAAYFCSKLVTDPKSPLPGWVRACVLAVSGGAVLASVVVVLRRRRKATAGESPCPSLGEPSRRAPTDSPRHSWRSVQTEERRPMADEYITSQPPPARSPASDARWQVIHAGNELGPLSLVELAEKVVAGEIDADDLVKETGGLWTKVRDVGLLRQDFLSRSPGEKAPQGTLDNFSRFDLAAYLVVGGVLLALVALVGVWNITKPTPPSAEIKDARLYFQRGNAWLDKKEYDKAIEDFNEAIRLEPRNADMNAFHSRGIAWFWKKEYDNAIQDFGEAIRLDPKEALYYFKRGLARSTKKEYNMAIKDYDKAIQIDPNYAIACYHRGYARLMEEDYDGAIHDFDEAIRLNPKDSFVFAAGGKAYLGNRDNDKANRDFDEARRLEKRPDVRLVMRSDGYGYVSGTVHNDTGKKIEKLKLSIKTARWDRIFEVSIIVQNNATARLSVFVADGQLDVESFEVLGAW
jgi:tetratricopeptide (TPR) repeat protein